MKRNLPFIIIGAALVAAVIGGFWFYRSSHSQMTGPVSPPAAPVTDTSAGPSTRGAVTLEEFGDYQCPPCGGIHPELKKIKAEYGDRVRFIFYHFPLTQMHKHALLAAQAAVAAGFQGKFWEMHDLLYQNQEAWAESPDLRPFVINFARRLGLDVNRFITDMDGAQANAVVASDYQRGLSLGVTGTPTLFINGQVIDNENTSLEGIKKEIDRRLSGLK